MSQLDTFWSNQDLVTSKPILAEPEAEVKLYSRPKYYHSVWAVNASCNYIVQRIIDSTVY